MRHFKKIVKSKKPIIRQICLVISQYFKDINFVIQLSPKEVFEQSTKDDLLYNFFLAKSYYLKKYGYRITKKGIKKPKSGKYWIDYDWSFFVFDKKSNEWIEHNSPRIPGTRNILKDENKITTQDILNKIKKTDQK